MPQTAKIILICLAVAIVSSAGTVFYFIQARQKQQTPPISLDQTFLEEDNQTVEKQDRSKEPNGPYYHQIYSASSKDGRTWEKQGARLFDHASVPGAVIRDGIIYLYFVDASGDTDGLSVGISKDLGKTFEKKSVKISNVKSRDAVDPHPELTNDGKIRLYYLGNFSQLPEMQKQDGKIKFYSAQSSDAINFSDVKAVYEDDTIITDPDVFRTGEDWRLLASKGKGLDLAISQDDGATFIKQDDFVWNKGGVSDTFNFDGTLRTYFCGQGQGIESSISIDSDNMTVESGTRITESGKIVCDPSIIQLPDKSYLMFYKTQDVLQQPQTSPMPNNNLPPTNPPLN